MTSTISAVINSSIGSAAIQTIVSAFKGVCFIIANAISYHRIWISIACKITKAGTLCAKISIDTTSTTIIPVKETLFIVVFVIANTVINQFSICAIFVEKKGEIWIQKEKKNLFWSLCLSKHYLSWSLQRHLHSEFAIFFRFISYSRCSNWRRILKFSLNFGCLFTFCNSAEAN